MGTKTIVDLVTETLRMQEHRPKSMIKLGDGHRHKIDLVATDACQLAPREMTLSHHSTPAMNYITWTQAFIALSLRSP